MTLSFHNADEPWLTFSRTAGHEDCQLDRHLTKGRTYGDELSKTLTCTVNMSGDVVLNAYWAEPKFAGATLSDFAEFPGCVQDGSPGYCPPTGS